jgi:hypothetical protein
MMQAISEPYRFDDPSYKLSLDASLPQDWEQTSYSIEAAVLRNSEISRRTYITRTLSATCCLYAYRYHSAFLT